MVDGASDDDGSNGPRLTSERSDVEKVNFIAFTEEQNINIILLSLLFNIPCHFLIKYARSAVGLSAKSFQILILLIPSKKLLPSIFPQISNGNSHPSLAISRPLPSIFHTTFPHCPHSFPTFSLLFFPRIIILILSDRQIQVRIGPLPPSRSNTPLLATFPHSTSVEAHCQRPMALRSSGEIHVILGPMFAGKTTALLRRMQAEIDCGRSVAMIKSDKDTRYGLESVVTHDGVKMACFALSELSTFREKLGAAAYDKLNVIGIDEAQFFEDLYDFCSNGADRDGKIVVVAGLDGDYLRRRFGSVLDVVPLADSVTKLTARCDICGKRAFFTRRKINEVQIELIGGADVYTPVCRQHYLDGHVAVEATRTILTVKTSPMIQNLKQLI